MYLSVNFLNWLNYFVLFQGVLFGTMLMLLHSKDSKPTFFLGVFVLLFSTGVLPQSFLGDNLLARGSDWRLSSISIYFFTYPFFYLYVQRISILQRERLSYWTLIPGVIALVIALFLCFGPFETVFYIKSSWLYTVYTISSLGYSIYISILIIKGIGTHFKELDNQYTSIHQKSLSWVKWFVITCILFYLVKVMSIIVFKGFNDVVFFLISSSLIYWVTFKGITQKTILPLVSHKGAHHDLMPKNEAIQLLGTVEAYIEASNCYVNDTFTIVDLAEAIHVHPKRISYAINSIKGIHFNKYINFFRVNYAKVLLKSNAVRQLSIEGIGMEAGFHSKTTFYKAFKSFEGMTPAKYKIS